MSQQQHILKGDTVQRLGSLGFIVGSVLLVLIATFDIVRDGGGTTQRVLVGFFGPVGLWGVMLGMAAIYRAVTGAGAGWARLGFYLIIIATAVWTVHMSLRAGLARVAAQGMTDTVTAIDDMIHQVVAMAYLSEWLGIFFIGIGMIRSTVYPKGLSWAGLLLGIVTFALGGVPMFLLGEGSFGEIVGPILAGLTTIWTLITGVWIARRAW